MGRKTWPQWLACLRYPFNWLPCPFNANITGWSGPKLAANRKSLLILVFPTDAEEFSIFPLSSLVHFLQVFNYIVGLRFFTRSMNRDNQCLFYRKWVFLAVWASHAHTWTLACDIVEVLKHKSDWWLSVIIDSFIHADGDFFCTAWCALKTDAHIKAEHCSYQQYSEAFRHGICHEACCRVWPHHQEHIQMK